MSPTTEKPSECYRGVPHLLYNTKLFYPVMSCYWECYFDQQDRLHSAVFWWEKMSTLTSDVFRVPNVTFGEICLATFSKLLLKYIVLTNVTPVRVNHSVNNYYVVKFVLEGASLDTGQYPVPRTWCVKFWYVGGKNSI